MTKYQETVKEPWTMTIFPRRVFYEQKNNTALIEIDHWKRDRRRLIRQIRKVLNNACYFLLGSGMVCLIFGCIRK